VTPPNFGESGLAPGDPRSYGIPPPAREYALTNPKHDDSKEAALTTRKDPGGRKRSLTSAGSAYPRCPLALWSRSLVLFVAQEEAELRPPWSYTSCTIRNLRRRFLVPHPHRNWSAYANAALPRHTATNGSRSAPQPRSRHRPTHFNECRATNDPNVTTGLRSPHII
jgi:hypothetical protein